MDRRKELSTWTSAATALFLLLVDVAVRDARAERYQNEIRGLTKELEHIQRFVRQIPREGGDE